MKKTLLPLALLALLAAGCNDLPEPEPLIQPGGGGSTTGGGTGGEEPTPHADFTYSPAKPIVGQTVKFTNLSEDAGSYIWGFGNGETSREENPTVKFDEAGTFTIVLMAYSPNATKADKATETLTVQPKPTAVTVTRYRVDKVYFADSGGRYWDDQASDGPDIYLGIYGSDGKLDFKEDTYKANVTQSMLPYYKSLGVTYNNLSASYKITMLDYDTWFDDTMATFTFTPGNYTSSYPGEVSLTAGSFGITLELEWK